MPKNWRRDQIQETWTEEQWNQMCKDAESGKSTGEIGDWNEFYNTVKHADDPDIIEWNKIYNGEIVPND